MEKNNISKSSSMNIIKPIILLAVILFLGHHSIEIKPLDQVRKKEKKFDATEYARNYLDHVLPASYEKAIPILDLIELLQKDKSKAFDSLSHAVSIGNVRNFLVQGKGIISKVTDDEIILKIKNKTISLALEYIYGSSIRDAAGLFDIKQFKNSADINNISSEIDNIIRKERVAKFKQDAIVGKLYSFIGALEMNSEYPQLDSLEVLPIETFLVID